MCKTLLILVFLRREYVLYQILLLKYSLYGWHVTCFYSQVLFASVHDVCLSVCLMSSVCLKWNPVQDCGGPSRPNALWFSRKQIWSEYQLTRDVLTAEKIFCSFWKIVSDPWRARADAHGCRMHYTNSCNLSWMEVISGCLHTHLHTSVCYVTGPLEEQNLPAGCHACFLCTRVKEVKWPACVLYNQRGAGEVFRSSRFFKRTRTVL